jgi:hypothetical protein
MTEPKLTIELVPKSCHFKNVRSEVSKEQWDKLRKQTYRAANYKCEICGGKGDKWPVECHEVWDYDEETQVQKLVRLIALCPACHEVKHLGLASLNGRFEEAVSHLRNVNHWGVSKTQDYLDEVQEDYKRRSELDWNLDISFLD